MRRICQRGSSRWIAANAASVKVAGFYQLMELGSVPRRRQPPHSSGNNFGKEFGRCFVCSAYSRCRCCQLQEHGFLLIASRPRTCGAVRKVRKQPFEFEWDWGLKI